mgnify:CR=1 FL=1
MSAIAAARENIARNFSGNSTSSSFAEDLQLALALDMSKEDQEMQRAIALSLQQKEKEEAASYKAGDFARIITNTGLSRSSSSRREQSLPATDERASHAPQETIDLLSDFSFARPQSVDAR